MCSWEWRLGCWYPNILFLQPTMMEVEVSQPRASDSAEPPALAGSKLTETDHRQIQARLFCYI